VMLWIEAERKEVDTLIEKGTYEIVDLPPGVTELDSMFQYKLKTGDKGQVLQRKVMKCELLSTELEGVVFTTPVIDWD
jgi:hypothetical protein